MVRGISKRIVLVPSPDKSMFEQAIFIVSEGVTTDEDVLSRAFSVAEQYLKEKKPINYGLRYIMYFLSGVFATGAFWFFSTVLF